jgi:ribonuclease P protein component
MTDQRLRKRERLTGRKELERVFQEGMRCGKGVVRITAAPNGLDHSRLGVGASSKLFNAVKRNRLKRLAREAFRLNKNELPTGLDMFVTICDENATLEQTVCDLKAASSVVAERLGT